MVAESHPLEQDDHGRDLRPARQQIEIPASTDRIVLVSPDLGDPNKPFPNLVRRTQEDKVVWTAELPTPLGGERPDAYVSVRWENSKLLANSFYGHRVAIDPDSGKITAQEFTK